MGPGKISEKFKLFAFKAQIFSKSLIFVLNTVYTASILLFCMRGNHASLPRPTLTRFLRIFFQRFLPFTSWESSERVFLPKKLAKFVRDTVPSEGS